MARFNWSRFHVSRTNLPYWTHPADGAVAQNITSKNDDALNSSECFYPSFFYDFYRHKNRSGCFYSFILSNICTQEILKTFQRVNMSQTTEKVHVLICWGKETPHFDPRLLVKVYNLQFFIVIRRKKHRPETSDILSLHSYNSLINTNTGNRLGLWKLLSNHPFYFIVFSVTCMHHTRASECRCAWVFHCLLTGIDLDSKNCVGCIFDLNWDSHRNNR